MKQTLRSLVQLLRQTIRWAAIGSVGCGLVAASGGCASWRPKKIVPDSVATCRQLSCDAVAAAERGATDEACSLLAHAVASSPRDIDARRQYSEALWKQGEREEAAIQMQAAVQLDSQHGPTVVRCGEMLLGLGFADRALSKAEEAIALDPTLAGAWELRGRVYRHRGELDRALADMHQALRYSPNNGNVLQLTAELQYQTGHPQRSLTTLHHLFEAAPPGEEPREALWLAGMAYGAVNRPTEAVANLTAASLKGDPPPELLYQLALAQNNAGQATEASATVRQALALNREHQGSQTLLAQLEGAGIAGVDTPIRR
jgi:tetratricopeptide (TPR) repeat protein